MKLRIFISTHPDLAKVIYGLDVNKYKTLNSKFLDKSSLEIPIFSKSKVLSLNEKGFFIETTENSNLILISDNLILNEFQRFEITNFDYLLHHNTIDNEIKDKFLINNRIEKKHSPNEKDIYRPVFDLVLNEEINFDEKINLIFNLIFGNVNIKESERKKADLLNIIYFGNKIDLSYYYHFFNRESQILELINYFEENPYNMSLDKNDENKYAINHRNKLKMLRDLILK